MKNILKNLLAVVLMVATATTAWAVDESFGFERQKDASSGMFSDFALESSYEKISLEWVESFESGRIQPLTGVFKYTIDGVEYSTSDGQTAYKYFGVDEAEWGYLDTDYFGFKMTIPAGVTLEPTRFYSSIVLGGGRIVYKVVLQNENGEELYKIGETPQDKEAIKNLDVDLSQSGLLLTEGTYRLLLYSYQWYGSVKTHLPVSFMLQGKVTDEDPIEYTQLTDLTVGGVSYFDRLVDNSCTVELPYGTTSFPEVAATADEKGHVEIVSPTGDTMKAEVRLIDNEADKLVATYTINFVPAEPAQGAVLRVEGGDAAIGSVQDGIYTDGTVSISPAPTIQSINGIWGLKMGFNTDYKISVPADLCIDEIRFVGAPVYGNCKIPYVIPSHETSRTTSSDSLYLSSENQTVAFKLLNHKAGDTLALKIDLWGEVINYIELISVADKKVVATPAIYVEEGQVSDTVTITSDTDNAIIYYTLDGTEPTTSSNRYTGRFMISSNCTVKAIATARAFHFEDSEVAEVVIDHFNTQGGFSFTFAPGDGTTVDLTGDSKYKYVRISDINPAFQIKGENTVYSDSRFKMSAGDEFAICVPGNAIVTKLTFVNACENYYNAETGANTDSEWDYIKSEGATVIISDDMKITSPKDITASIQNHTAGMPILFRIKKCAQFAFGGIVIEYAQMNDNAVEYIEANIEDGAVVNASGSFTLTFDREVTLNEGAQMQIDGEPIRTVSNGTTVTGYYWELPYSSTHTLTLPTNAVSDIFGNTYGEEISISFGVEEQPVVAMSCFDYIVTNVEELNVALNEIAQSNTTAESPRKRILLLNGDYYMGQVQTTVKGYNISIIGQSKEGVRIYNDGLDGIKTSSTINNESQALYMQDLTIENAESLRKGNFRGVYVAYSGGNKAILKNVELIGGQDTYVTGTRAYHEDCTIHGTVDFICGGGDNYFYRTDLLIEGDAVITAPSHEVSTEWGYVFQECTVKPGTYAETTPDKSYSLGRPWQNEPRCYFLHTVMEILPTDIGWAGMAEIPTHFYEYQSVNKEGNLIDLSVRGNSPSSTNQYTPVLSDEEAAEFTVYNVVGGKDGWTPARYTRQVEAPVVTLQGDTLVWNSVADALCYVIYKDGTYVANTTDTRFELANQGEGAYTVCATNEMGGQGDASNVVEYSVVSSVKEVKAGDNDDKEIYDLMGRRLQHIDRPGVYIVGGKKVIYYVE